MAIEQHLYATLKDIPGGLYEMFAPQNKGHPYSTYQVISDIKTNALGGQCFYNEIRFQIDIYSDKLKDVRDISRLIQKKLLEENLFRCIIYQTFRNMTEDGLTPHEVIDFKIIFDPVCRLHPSGTLFPDVGLFPCQKI